MASRKSSSSRSNSTGSSRTYNGETRNTGYGSYNLFDDHQCIGRLYEGTRDINGGKSK